MTGCSGTKAGDLHMLGTIVRNLLMQAEDELTCLTNRVQKLRSIIDIMEGEGSTQPDREQYRKARRLVVRHQKASVSWLQRKLRVPYPAAARLIERMEWEGIVGAPNHVGQREVLYNI